MVKVGSAERTRSPEPDLDAVTTAEAERLRRELLRPASRPVPYPPAGPSPQAVLAPPPGRTPAGPGGPWARHRGWDATSPGRPIPAPARS
ncbi:hypothetical protein HBB16_16760 [Pseudonocardia sp. MCCB 268]|nr:hypothetical protein [Pseudonocardia cytotoxica]